MTQLVLEQGTQIVMKHDLSPRGSESQVQFLFFFFVTENIIQTLEFQLLFKPCSNHSKEKLKKEKA